MRRSCREVIDGGSAVGPGVSVRASCGRASVVEDDSRHRVCPPQDGDAALRFVTGRRPVFEAVIAGLAADEPGLRVRRGVRLAGLVAGPSAVGGVPHVAGMVSTDGEVWKADLVVDAMGRRSPSSSVVAS